MLEEMDAHQLPEWLAVDRINAEERRRADLAARAEAGVQNRRRRG